MTDSYLKKHTACSRGAYNVVGPRENVPLCPPFSMPLCETIFACTVMSCDVLILIYFTLWSL